MPSSMKRHSWESVLTCCDSFKGTLTACNAGLALERAFRCVEKGGSARAEVVHCPMSDGGAGLLDSLFFPSHSALSSPYIFTRVDVPTAGTTDSCDSTPAPLVLGPLGEPLNYGGGEYRPHFACDVANRVVVVEMAVASGLPMIPRPSGTRSARRAMAWVRSSSTPWSMLRGSTAARMALVLTAA
ncbi:hypothetical protein TcBrA4_0115410 [Trypanosoma cruzi]|nr:hypothetical protein TcBrA4_0115410 [Trypanosoma cruzi]